MEALSISPYFHGPMPSKFDQLPPHNSLVLVYRCEDEIKAQQKLEGMFSLGPTSVFLALLLNTMDFSRPEPPDFSTFSLTS